MKNIKKWFLISLCVNFLLLGVFIAGFFHAKSGGHKAHGARDEISLIVRYAPDSIRSEIRDEIMKYSKSKPSHPSSFDISDLTELLEKPDVDALALKALFAKRRSDWDDRVEHAHETIAEALVQLSLEERQELANSIRKGFSRQGKR